MCTQEVLSKVSNEVVRAAKESLGDKLDKVILFGSYARGDFSSESDIDIMVLANIPLENRGREREKIRSHLDNIDLKFDIVLALKVTDCETFEKFLPVEPFYQRVATDGVLLNA